MEGRLAKGLTRAADDDDDLRTNDAAFTPEEETHATTVNIFHRRPRAVVGCGRPPPRLVEGIVSTWVGISSNWISTFDFLKKTSRRRPNGKGDRKIPGRA